MSGRAFVDTNVLVYAYDRSEPAKRELARRVLVEHAAELVVSAQVLAELYVVTTRKLAEPLSEEDAAAAVERWARLPVVALDAGLVATAASLSRAHDLAYWDGLIVAAAAAAGCDRVLTEDLSDGTTIAGVRIENPFRAADAGRST